MKLLNITPFETVFQEPVITVEFTQREAAALCLVLGSLDTLTIEKLTDDFLKENEKDVQAGNEDTKKVCEIVTNDQTHPFGYINDLFSLLADHFVEQ